MASRHVYVHVMEVIRHAELIVEWFLWTIEHTNRSLDNSNATFRPSRASSGETLHLNYQVTCWCARSSKGTILLCVRACVQYVENHGMHGCLVRNLSVSVICILYISLCVCLCIC